MKPSSKFYIAIIFVIALHILTINVNYAEWGDSYRILRASQHIRDFSYPADEKRPPLYSLVLATYPSFVDPVAWGKLVMFGFSLLGLFLFLKLFDLLSITKTEESKVSALLLFMLNPVYFYWSLRLYADVPFSILTVFALYLVTKWRDVITTSKILVLAVLAALAVLTRFEGFILFGALGFGILFAKQVPLTIGKRLQSAFIPTLTYVTSFVMLLLPYFVWRNPFTSSYFAEPSNRVYDVNTFLIFVVSLVFLFGFVFAAYFLWDSRNKFLTYLRSYPAITAFIVVDLLLIAAWPAAIPRLFIPLVPFLAIPLADYIYGYFNNSAYTWTRFSLLMLALLLGVYGVSQYFFKLQFLVVIKEHFVVIVALQLLLFACILFKKRALFYSLLMVSLVLWTGSILYAHRNIYRTLAESGEFMRARLCGDIVHNDVSSVTDWYLNDYTIGENCKTGIYYDVTTSEPASVYEYLTQNDIEYVLITTEHNPQLLSNFKLNNYPYLDKLVETSSVANGRVFQTIIYEFEGVEQ